MSLTPDQQAATQAAAARIRARLNLPAVASDWSFDDRQAYLAAFAAEVKARPDEFGTVQNAQAEKILTAGVQHLESYGVLDKAGDFGLEVLEQAERLNPLSERNAGKTSAVIIAAVIVVAGIWAWNLSRAAAAK
jgi:acyl-CoA reductase-like NAD-dependent aldehyde dehydrogenase